MNWNENNHYLNGYINNLEQLHDPIRVASFDLDDTLIHRPNSRINNEKAKLIDLTIVHKITDLVKNNYIIVIFTNQNGMTINKNYDKLAWRQSVDELIALLTSGVINKKFFVSIYAAKNDDLYRKPNIGLWKQMKSDLKDIFHLDMLRISKLSFFCGDAAGRANASTLKKKLHPKCTSGDHSDCDLKFAANIGINFITPEEFYAHNISNYNVEFKNAGARFLGFNPQKYLEYLNKNPPLKYKFKPRSREMIVMVAAPGSGKTCFVKKYILANNYVHVNADTCKTKKKCLALTTQALEAGTSVVIDNTNPNVMSRMEYTTLAQKYNYKHIRCIVLNTDIDLAMHLNNLRHVYSGGKIPKINKIVYNIFKKNFVKPIPSEHFDVIENINFIFDIDKLNDLLWKKLFCKWS